MPPHNTYTTSRHEQSPELCSPSGDGMGWRAVRKEDSSCCAVKIMRYDHPCIPPSLSISLSLHPSVHPSFLSSSQPHSYTLPYQLHVTHITIYNPSQEYLVLILFRVPLQDLVAKEGVLKEAAILSTLSTSYHHPNFVEYHGMDGA